MGKYVNPIRSKQERQMLLDALREQSERNYCLGLTGMITGLRISDLTLLTVRHIRSCKKEKDRNNYTFYILNVTEKKTNKEREIYISKPRYEELYEYCKNKPAYEYLFKSRNGRNKKLSERQASRIIKEAAERIGIEYDVSSHSLRKSYAYDIYTNTKDINLVADILQHTNTTVTRRYIGIDKEARYKASIHTCNSII